MEYLSLMDFFPYPFAEVPYCLYFRGRNINLPVHVQRFQQESSYNRATKEKIDQVFGETYWFPWSWR